MATGILPRKPRTRKGPADKWITDRIGPRRNGRQHDAPLYRARDLTDAEREAQGYVRAADLRNGGWYWQRADWCSAVDLFGPEGDAARADLQRKIDALGAPDKAKREAADKAARVNLLRQMAEEFEANSASRCAFCRAPDGGCSH